MYLFIQDGKLHIHSDCDTLRIEMVPRRSAASPGTRVVFFADGVSSYARLVEDLPRERAGEWVWTGSLRDAQRLVDRTLRILHTEMTDPDRRAGLAPDIAPKEAAFGQLLDRYIDDDLRHPPEAAPMAQIGTARA